MKIAIIGGGPAGGSLAWRLAVQGISATCFDDSHPREKPCGGGITGRGWRELPLLAELNLPCVEVSRSVYTPYSMKPTAVVDHEPIRIVDRNRLDRAILDAAVRAGAAWRAERVRSLAREGGRWAVNGEAFDLVVGADGHNGITRRTLSRPLDRSDRMLCVGYFVPGPYPPGIWIEFFPGFRGYAWFFPRTDHVSVGVGDCDGAGDKNALYERLHLFLARRFPQVDLTGAKRFGGICPGIKGSFDRYPFTGEGWMLIGDAGGFCDPLTGEGLYYAFASARLCAEAIVAARDAAGAVDTYRVAANAELVPGLEKAGKYLRYFFRPWFMEIAMLAIRRSVSANRVAAGYVSGSEGLIGFKRRILRAAPRIVCEMAAGRRAR